MSETSKTVILVADDCEINRDILNLYLSKSYEVHFAEDGVQAVEMAKAHSPHVILMDMQMPNMSGYDATQSIRRNEVQVNKKPAVIISITASSEDEDRHDSKGYTDFISKPINKKKLVEMINKHLSDIVKQTA